jgi:hypothetical protein
LTRKRGEVFGMYDESKQKAGLELQMKRIILEEMYG